LFNWYGGVPAGTQDHVVFFGGRAQTLERNLVGSNQKFTIRSAKVHAERLKRAGIRSPP